MQLKENTNSLETSASNLRGLTLFRIPVEIDFSRRGCPQDSGDNKQLYFTSTCFLDPVVILFDVTRFYSKEKIFSTELSIFLGEEVFSN